MSSNLERLNFKDVILTSCKIPDYNSEEGLEEFLQWCEDNNLEIETLRDQKVLLDGWLVGNPGEVVLLNNHAITVINLNSKLSNMTNHITVDEINAIIKESRKKPEFKENDISDGYHTFQDLYDLLKVTTANLYNEWAAQGKHRVHKSKKHFTGEQCFGGGWFIVCADLPLGKISKHFKLEDWDLFGIPSYDKALWQWDGHNTRDVINRLTTI